MVQWRGMHPEPPTKATKRAKSGTGEALPSLSPRQKRRARLLGAAFVALGIPGLVLPFLQGALFLFLGVFLLSFTSSWFDALLRAGERRHPRIARTFSRMRRKAREWL